MKTNVFMALVGAAMLFASCSLSVKSTDATDVDTTAVEIDSSSIAVVIRSAEQFDKLTHADGVVLVDFNATWCGPCHQMDPILEQLGQKHKDLQILKVDIDRNTDLVERYGIHSIPAMYLLKDGKEVWNTVGTTTLETLEEEYKKCK